MAMFIIIITDDAMKLAVLQALKRSPTISGAIKKGEVKGVERIIAVSAVVLWTFGETIAPRCEGDDEV